MENTSKSKSSNLFFLINIQNKYIVHTLFAVMFIYLIARAICVEPLLDELATLFYYIQTGNIVNSEAIVDANNHLLNSYVSHYVYSYFGDHLLSYRLLAIISFPIFFYSLKKLISENLNKYNFIVFISLISVHWIFDYFSLSRGYGPSLAFFTLGLSFIFPWNKSYQLKNLALISISFILCVLSNLSMIVPVSLLYTYLLFTFLISWKQHNLSKKIGCFAIVASFISGIYALYLYIQKLKEAKALWWGSQDGLWEVTGKSISENIFFTDSELIKYLLIGISIILVYAFINQFIKKGFYQFILSIQFWSFALFLLSVLSAVGLVIIMDVNYPQDRVAMYLVTLLILSMGSLFPTTIVSRYLVFLLLWFPISFIYKINLNTTIFSPYDRMHDSFVKEVYEIVNPESSFSADYIASTCYAYGSRKYHNRLITDLNNGDTLIGEEFHLKSIYGNKKNLAEYERILYDEVTDMELYKRKSIGTQTILKDTTIESQTSNNLYISLAKCSIPKNHSFNSLKMIISASIQLDKEDLKLSLIQSLANANNPSIDYNNVALDRYYGDEKEQVFTYSRLVPLQKNEKQTMTIYYHNQKLSNVKINYFNIRIYGLY